MGWGKQTCGQQYFLFLSFRIFLHRFVKLCAREVKLPQYSLKKTLVNVCQADVIIQAAAYLRGILVDIGYFQAACKTQFTGYRYARISKDGLDQCGFSAAVGTFQPDTVTLPECKSEVLQDDGCTISKT